MCKKSFLFILLLFISPQLWAESEKPNFLIIQVDDMGFDDLSVNGNTVSKTPNIDALAQESVRFSNFFVNSVCSPTRASLLTGRDFWRTGVSAMHGGRDFMNLDETTFADVFQQNGYTTGMWGKWHSGKADGYWPWDRGFDEAYYAKLYNYFPSNGWLNEYPKKTTHKGKWSPEVLADYTIDFISRKKDEPFLAYVSFLTCHGKWKAPKERIEKYKTEGRTEQFATLLAMLEYMDEQVGRILSHLEKEGLDENTIVLFLSDNGPMKGKKTKQTEWELRNNHAFLGNKARLWQNGIKSPLYVRHKGSFKSADVERLVSVTDIFPTLLDLAGISVPKENKKLDGRSVKTYMQGNTQSLPSKTAIFAHWHPEWEGDQFQPVPENVKANLDFEQQRITMISEEYKLLLNPVRIKDAPAKKDNVVLIDLKNDPLERKNVATEHPKVVKTMKTELSKWFSEVKATEGSFSAPEFQIAWKDKKESEMLAYGPSAVVGAKNANRKITGFKKVGDRVEYQINVHKASLYSIFIERKNCTSGAFTIKVSCSNKQKEVKLKKQDKQYLAKFRLPKGQHTFAIEMTGVEEDKKGKFGIINSFRFKREDEVGSSSPKLSTETLLLYKHLKDISKTKMLFGQQFAFHEGQKWANKKAPKKLKSDCHAAVGKHPAVHGFDFGRSKDFHSWDKYVKAVQRMGGISTYSWHARNPVTGGGAKDKKDNPVASILEKEKYRKIWLEELDKVADVFNSLKVGGKKIPIIFRPFHENTGRWFWWGSPNCTPEQYVELWRLTVDYLRKEKGVNNILMAYSPSKPSQNIELTKAMYPGDEYVDIIGFDAYDSNENLPKILLESARFVCKWAEKTDKVAAITETGISKGLQNSVSSTWFTKEFLEVIKNDSIARNVTFALTWRNSATDSYWIPVKGQKNYEDFVTFSKDDFVVFLDPDKQKAK